MNNMQQTAQLTQNLSKNNIDLLDKENKINISGEINGKIENNEIRINNKNESKE